MKSDMLEYKGYRAVIGYDANDRILVGEVFGIKDILSFHGNSIDELENMFHQSIDNYLELCIKIGKEPEREYTGSFNVRLSPSLHKSASLEAFKEKISLNQFITRAVEAYISE